MHSQKFKGHGKELAVQKEEVVYSTADSRVMCKHLNIVIFALFVCLLFSRREFLKTSGTLAVGYLSIGDQELVHQLMAINLMQIGVLVMVRFCSCIAEGLSTVQPPTMISVEGFADRPIAGQDYTLTCVYSGHGNTVPSIRWLGNGGVLNGQTTSDLNFHPLNVTDSGVYSCEVTVESITVRSPVPYCLVVEGKTKSLTNWTGYLQCSYDS